MENSGVQRKGRRGRKGQGPNLGSPLPSPAWQLHLVTLQHQGSAALKYPVCVEAQPTAWPPVNTQTRGCRDQKRKQRQPGGATNGQGCRVQESLPAGWPRAGAGTLSEVLLSVSIHPSRGVVTMLRGGQRLREGTCLPGAPQLSGGRGPGRCLSRQSYFLHSHFSS